MPSTRDLPDDIESLKTLVIAQRVSTVQNADQIIVLDHGAIVGMGQHRDLLESNSIYAEIYQLQLMDETVLQTFGSEDAVAAAAGLGRTSQNGARWELATAGPRGPWDRGHPAARSSRAETASK